MSAVEFGPATLQVPDGWNETGREGERVTFLHDDKLEHVTISYRHFARNPTFSEFEALCEQRLASERAALADGFLEQRGPNQGGDGGFTLIFFGGDRETARMFSGLLVLVVDTLLAIYVEGSDVEPERHQQSFAAFAQGWSLTPRSAS